MGIVHFVQSKQHDNRGMSHRHIVQVKQIVDGDRTNDTIYELSNAVSVPPNNYGLDCV